MDAYWPVGATPKRSQSFYSPWFGIDASDNLNLLQPVNPWMGNEWLIYNEYYQWSPSHNQNSAQHVVKAKDLLYGSVSLDPKTKSYNVYHNVSGSTTWDVTMNIPIQKGKTYTIAYVVYEKVAPCGDYPPDGSVTFSQVVRAAMRGDSAVNAVLRDATTRKQQCGAERCCACACARSLGARAAINAPRAPRISPCDPSPRPPPSQRVFCDNKLITPAWKTGFVEDACNNRATIVDPSTVKITWNTQAADPAPELIAASQSKPFAPFAAAKKAGGIRGDKA